MRRGVGLLVATLLALAGCSSSKPAATTPTPTPSLLDGCVRTNEAEVLHLVASDGQKITGALFGSGTKGVFLGHIGAGNLCPWAEYAKTLAGKGYMVVAVDYRGFGSSELSGGVGKFEVERDTIAAIDELRKRGAKSVVLIGASLGAMGSMRAAATVTPPVQGVIQISGPTKFPGMDISASLPKVRVPVLFIGSEGDVNATENIPAELKSQYAKIASKDKRIVLFEDFEHGTDLFQSRFADRFRAEMEKFLAAHSA
jgi:pimeloyl-ACP methyl ester carboxylesterase